MSKKREGLDVIIAESGNEYTRVSGIAEALTDNGRTAKRIRNKIVNEASIPKIEVEDTLWADNRKVADFIKNDLQGRPIVRQHKCEEVVNELCENSFIDDGETKPGDDFEGDMRVLHEIRETFKAVMPYDHTQGAFIFRDLLFAYDLARQKWFPNPDSGFESLVKK